MAYRISSNPPPSGRSFKTPWPTLLLSFFTYNEISYISPNSTSLKTVLLDFFFFFFLTRQFSKCLAEWIFRLPGKQLLSTSAYFHISVEHFLNTQGNWLHFFTFHICTPFTSSTENSSLNARPRTPKILNISLLRFQQLKTTILSAAQDK